MSSSAGGLRRVASGNQGGVKMRNSLGSLPEELEGVVTTVVRWIVCDASCKTRVVEVDDDGFS